MLGDHAQGWLGRLDVMTAHANRCADHSRELALVDDDL
eukprot:gene7280-7817_t